jgi:large subunit ribosomal protein L19e
MSIKLTNRIASRLMGRGTSKIRIKKDAYEDASKAITAEDVRTMIKDGKIYAIKEKHNISIRSKITRLKKMKGRKRGIGSRRGTPKARRGIEYKKKVRAQRRVLRKLKSEKVIDNESFKRFYALVKGGTFENKASLISHMKSRGVAISDEKAAELKHI